MRSKKFLLAYLGISVPILVALVAATTVSLYVKDAQSNGSYGEIALRSYYDHGSGDSIEDPYVITRPRHLYNLSRLQGLGVYGTKKYFRIGEVGLNGDQTGLPVCYADDSSLNTVPYLDMTNSLYDNERIIAIGSESTPFYGEFNGNNVEIKNLTVYADPEDAGLFGYTAHTSKISNLFLDNITINTLGYESIYEKLYSDTYELEEGETRLRESVSLLYGTDLSSPTKTFVHGSEEYALASFDCQAYFNWLSLTAEQRAETPAPALPTALPAVAYSETNSAYKYKFLPSGSFLTSHPTNSKAMMVNLADVFEFFHSKRELAKTDSTLAYPLQASSSVSLVASATDNDGLDHSRVLLTLEFDFSLASADATEIELMVRLGKDHSNNIGLIVGHCDGSIDQCYVHNGNFIMNKKPTGATGTYNPMANGSELGLVGLIGGTVYNLTAKESDGSAQSGKSIGVLDFTTIFDDIIDDDSFDGATLIENEKDEVIATTFTPKDSLYRKYLRRNNLDQYVTAESNDENKRHRQIAFKGQEIVSTPDLGVFTVVTDYEYNGLGNFAAVGLDKSLVTKEQLDVSRSNDGRYVPGGRIIDGKYVHGDYYLYYATGEYRKGAVPGLTFDQYRNTFDSDTPTQMLLGHHLPNYNNVTIDSFAWRELHHNYFFRFKLEPEYRSNHGLYFSDVNKNSWGGGFLNKYFGYKLVDESNIPIPEGARRGVALWNSSGHEIDSFSAAYHTTDNSLNNAHMMVYGGKISNAVNFEVKTDYANITVVASPAEKDKPAALGVYSTDYATNMSDNTYDVNRHFDDPDYAFFMPRDSRLAYFDYNPNHNTGVGEIGVYDSTFKKLEDLDGLATEATIAKAPGVTEHAYPDSDDIPRLYVHTFKLPHGNYCLGSATGVNSLNTHNLGVANIYYVAAQGQTDGQIEFANNVYVSNDRVENIDFLQTSRYVNGKVAVLLEGESNTLDNSLIAPSFDTLANRRCYISLLSSDRSSFYGVQGGELTFAYNNGTFVITEGNGQLSAIEKVAVTSYRHNKFPALTNIGVSLFGDTDMTDTGIIKYPAASSG